MATEDRAQELLAKLEDVAAQHGVDIVDVEIVGATKAPCVRIRIDWLDETKDGISLDEVAAQNDWISAALDEYDPFPGSYTLEVSSPGLDRPLRREKDFVRFVGEQVSLTTTATEGRKRFTGTLKGFKDGNVVLDVEGEGAVAIPLDEVRRCTIKPTF